MYARLEICFLISGLRKILMTNGVHLKATIHKVSISLFRYGLLSRFKVYAVNSFIGRYVCVSTCGIKILAVI